MDIRHNAKESHIKYVGRAYTYTVLVQKNENEQYARRHI